MCVVQGGVGGARGVFASSGRNKPEAESDSSEGKGVSETGWSLGFAT